jgi:hypothetical protein
MARSGRPPEVAVVSVFDSNMPDLEISTESVDDPVDSSGNPFGIMMLLLR